jgi:alginate O-acetyltransferase complex protein AlgI
MLIVFSRAIFYFLDFEKLKIFVVNLFYSKNPVRDSFMTDALEHIFWFGLVIIFCIPWEEVFSPESKVRITANNTFNVVKPAVNIALLFLATLLLVNSTYNPFLYFRF